MALGSGDPSHKRIVQVENLVFLDQSEYTRQVGITPMSHSRYLYKATSCAATSPMTAILFRSLSRPSVQPDPDDFQVQRVCQQQSGPKRGLCMKL